MHNIVMLKAKSDSPIKVHVYSKKNLRYNIYKKLLNEKTMKIQNHQYVANYPNMNIVVYILFIIYI